MDAYKNPFNPGAGCPPPALSGRDDVLEQAHILLGRILRGRSACGMLLTGLRGVGKTALLQEIGRTATHMGYHVAAFEVREGYSLASALVPQLRTILYALDTAAGVGEKVRRSLMVLRNFISSIKLTAGEFSMDIEPLRGVADSGELSTDMPQLFLAAAEAAREKQSGILLLVDEMQLLEKKEFNALILAMHIMQQEQVPLVLIGAGLPTLPRLAGEAKSYAERLFDYPVIDRLDFKSSCQAIQQPAQREDAIFTPEALQAIFDRTQGYPYFLQVWAYHVWNQAEASPISEADVHAAAAHVQMRLDDGFFRVRYDRLTEAEKRFTRAMAELNQQECSVAEVARILQRKASGLGTTRDRLIRKGMIYTPRHGVVAFTVPLFDDFLRRKMPMHP